MISNSRLATRLPVSEASIRDLAAAGCLTRWQALAFLGVLSTPGRRAARVRAARARGPERICWLRLAERG